MNQKPEWENFFSRNTATEWYPSEPVIRLLCSYKKTKGAENVKILDLGCGNGRHVWLAAQEGFQVYGIDLSDSAIKLARDWLNREGLKVKDLRSGDITTKLPYSDNFFDLVISYGVLDHMLLSDSKRVVAEISRILKIGGLMFLKLESNTSFTFDPGNQINKNEIILDKIAEKGMIQHFFDKDEVAALVSDFVAVQSYRDDYRRFDNLNKNYQSRWIFIGQKNEDRHIIIGR